VKKFVACNFQHTEKNKIYTALSTMNWQAGFKQEAHDKSYVYYPKYRPFSILNITDVNFLTFDT
jgi:hypothetical protein